jgi:phage pi2 protein 07
VEYWSNNTGIIIINPITSKISYIQVIKEAILTLRELSGSTEKAIGADILSNHPNRKFVQWSFRVALMDGVNRGDFVHIEERYKITEKSNNIVRVEVTKKYTKNQFIYLTKEAIVTLGELSGSTEKAIGADILSNYPTRKFVQWSFRVALMNGVNRGDFVHIEERYKITEAFIQTQKPSVKLRVLSQSVRDNSGDRTNSYTWKKIKRRFRDFQASLWQR